MHGLDGTDGVISLSVSSMNDTIALVFTDSGKVCLVILIWLKVSD